VALSALGVPEQPGRTLMETLSDHLRNRRLLLILDNCEHLIEASARLAEFLLRACPNLKILATSREGLGILGESAWAVPTLSAPDLQHLASLQGEELLSLLSSYESVQLFIARAAAV
jgi:non-specific serine/threonine protein kinase